MSYDLGIWFGVQAIGRDESKARYFAMCDDDQYVDLVGALPDIAALVPDLTDEYPAFGEASRDECPWTAPFSVFRGAVIIRIDQSYSHQLTAWVKLSAKPSILPASRERSRPLD